MGWFFDVIALAFVAAHIPAIWFAFTDMDDLVGNGSHITPVDIRLLEKQVAELEATLTKLRATDV